MLAAKSIQYYNITQKIYQEDAYVTRKFKTHQKIQRSVTRRTYSILLENLEGMAVVSLTTYHNEAETDTLIIRLQDYTLTFFADIT